MEVILLNRKNEQGKNNGLKDLEKPLQGTELKLCHDLSEKVERPWRPHTQILRNAAGKGGSGGDSIIIQS